MSVYCFDYTDVVVLKSGIKLYGKNCVTFLQESGRIASEVLQKVAEEAVEGVSLYDLDRFAEDLIFKEKAEPAFLGFNGYPFSTCLSVNENIVHGIPTNKKLKNGEVLSIDLGVKLNGMCADNAKTIVIGGDEKSNHKKIIQTAERAFYKGMEKAKVGFTIGDISHAIHKEVLKESILDSNGSDTKLFKIFFNFQGHGIGELLHEPPDVPNMGFIGKGPKILPGMSLCLEPVVMYRTSDVEESFIEIKNTHIAQFKTSNYMPSSHFEKQIYITMDGPIIIT